MHLRIASSLLVLVALAAAGCEEGADPWNDEPEPGMGAGVLALTKSGGGTNGVDTDYCSDGTCITGEGDCDFNWHCRSVAGNVCGVDNGPDFGMPAAFDVCVPVHCTNRVQDADETGIDCGGASCGPICDGACGALPPSPSGGSCSIACPCSSGEADCDVDAQCASGLICVPNIGANYNFLPDYDVCAPAHCGNGVRDADETHRDCGGADCGSNCAAACAGLPSSGNPGHCTFDCPCAARDAECAGDATCATGLICVPDVGAALGFGATDDVCLSATCTNGSQDGDEEGIDCGPTCLPCTASGAAAAAYGGPGTDLATSVVVDSGGNSIVVGRFHVTADFGGAPLTAPGPTDKWEIYVAKYGPDGSHLWSRRFGSTESDGLLGATVAVSDTGEIAVAGSCTGTVDFGTGPIVGNSPNPDVCVFLLESNGTTRWARMFGDAAIDTARGVDFDGTNVYVVGSFGGTINFGGAALTTSGADDVFAARFAASNGAHLASARFGGTGADVAYDVASQAGQVFLTGTFRNTITFGSFSGTSLGSDDLFVVRISAAMVPIAARFFGSASVERGNGVDVDSGGNPVIVGHFSSTVNFGVASATSAGSRDIFVLSLTRGLVDRWVRTFGGTGVDSAADVSIDQANGDVMVSGSASGSIANFPVAPSTGLGGTDAFVAVYSRLGTAAFGVQEGGSGNDTALGVGFRGGFFTEVGGFEGTATFQGVGLTSAGSDDAFVSRQAY